MVSKIEIPKDLERHSRSKSVIGICEELAPEQLIDIAASYNLWHLIQQSTPYFASELKTSEIMISDLEKYLNNPVSSILLPEKAGPDAETQLLMLSTEFSKASHKQEVIESLRLKLGDIKCSESQRQEMLLVADEMFTNAIYNAPHVNERNNGPGVERNAKNGNLELRAARIFLGNDGARVVIGCEDKYGTLNVGFLLKRLRNCFAKGAAASINYELGGAGIGTYMMFRSALSYYAGVAHGKKTVVACTFPGRRGKFQPSQNLHLSTDKPGNGE
jgi:hypothetical protein